EAAAARGGRPNGRSASPPLAVDTSAIPRARTTTSGWRSARAMSVIPPMECPASTSGPAGATAARTAARSSASWSIVIVAGSTAEERPWPRWSGRTTRTGARPAVSDRVTGPHVVPSSVQPWTRTTVTGASAGPSSRTCSGTPSAAGTVRSVVTGPPPPALAGIGREDVEERRVVGVHEDREDDRVERQVHRHHVGQRSGALEDVALQQRERHREHRTPAAVAQLPQERHEHHRLQQVRLPEREVVAQQGEDDADEEQFVPQPDRVDADEQPGDLVRPGDLRPVPVGARPQEVDRQDQVARADDRPEVAELEPARPIPGAHRQREDVLP